MSRQPVVSTDSVAQDQIRAFVERILRDGIDTPRALVESIEGRNERHAHCLDRLTSFDRRAPIAIGRARSGAAQLLGCRNDTVVHRAAMVKRHGSITAAIAALDWMSGPVWPVPMIGYGLVGYVYAMAAVDFPGVFKVGFSIDPDRRKAELQARHKIELRLLASVPGTRVDESLVHHDMRRHALANEWFDLIGNFQRPTSPLLTPDRMWREMREAA